MVVRCRVQLMLRSFTATHKANVISAFISHTRILKYLHYTHLQNRVHIDVSFGLIARGWIATLHRSRPRCPYLREI
jgi:hypothetical protein